MNEGEGLLLVQDTASVSPAVSPQDFSAELRHQSQEVESILGGDPEPGSATEERPGSDSSLQFLWSGLGLTCLQKTLHCLPRLDNRDGHREAAGEAEVALDIVQKTENSSLWV